MHTEKEIKDKLIEWQDLAGEEYTDGYINALKWVLEMDRV